MEILWIAIFFSATVIFILGIRMSVSSYFGKSSIIYHVLLLGAPESVNNYFQYAIFYYFLRYSPIVIRFWQVLANICWTIFLEIEYLHDFPFVTPSKIGLVIWLCYVYITIHFIELLRLCSLYNTCSNIFTKVAISTISAHISIMLLRPVK